MPVIAKEKIPGIGFGGQSVVSRLSDQAGSGSDDAAHTSQQIKQILLLHQQFDALGVGRETDWRPGSENARQRRAGLRQAASGDAIDAASFAAWALKALSISV